MKQLVAVTVVTLSVGTASAQPPASGDKDQVVCALLGNCATDARAETTPSGNARVGATRGFSFTRSGDAQPGAQKPARGAPARRPARRPQPANYDLRVSFVSGSAELSPDSEARVRTFADALNDPRLAARRVRIEGHTDSVGSAAGNLDLSQRRARAVADLVSADGVDSARLDVRGFGATRPLPGASGRDPANRRVVATLVK